MKAKLLTLIFISLTFSIGSAQSTVLDVTFGISGKATCAFGPNDNILTVMALQSDGKIVAGGSYWYAPGFELMTQAVFCRFNTDGSLDASFGIDGRVVVAPGTYSQIEISQILSLDDDKILVVGSTTHEGFNGGYSGVVLYKFNSDGSPDESFGDSGFVNVATNSIYSMGNAMAIQPDNKIVIGGHNQGVGMGFNFCVFRLNPDGTPDDSFGTSGLVSINLGTENDPAEATYEVINDIKLLPDGKILAGGLTKGNHSHDHDTSYALIKLNEDGSVDQTFGDSGRVLTSFGNDREMIENIHILADQKILAVGTMHRHNSSIKKITVARYNSDGSLDLSYGTIGQVIFDNGELTPKYSMYSSLINAEGNLVVAGVGNIGNLFRPLLMRFDQQGAPDNTFGTNGIFFEESGVVPNEVLMQPDGKLLIAGTKYNEINIGVFEVDRYESELLAVNTFTNKPHSAVYPNPFDAFLNVDLNQKYEDEISMILTDVSGKEVMKTKIVKAVVGYNSIKLNLPENLQKGVYFLRILGARTSSTFKIIK